MPPKTEVLRWLTKQGACHEALTWARKQKTGKAIVEKCERADWLEWLLARLDGEAREEYKKIERSAWEEYEKILRPAWEEY